MLQNSLGFICTGNNLFGLKIKKKLNKNKTKIPWDKLRKTA